LHSILLSWYSTQKRLEFDAIAADRERVGKSAESRALCQARHEDSKPKMGSPSADELWGA
jgi:hypothetical protein